MGDRAAKTALFEQFARVGKALSHPTRLELIDLLAQGERTVEALATAAQLAISTTSAHLQALKRAQLVSTRREGTRVYHTLAGDDIAQLYVHLRTIAQTHLADTEAARRVYLGLHGEATNTAQTADPLEEIDREELLQRVRNGQAVVLDVRPRQEYAHGHIPGAISIPVDELPHRLAELPADRTIVAYCRGRYCVFAHDAVRQLRASGHHALRLAEGMLEWRLAGLPVNTAAA